jgi:carbonic anhydrase/acetyltransferase-like protein (isoleucine patch superfamily)
MPILAFDGIQPALDPEVFVAPDAWVIGATTIEARCSLFFGVVVRGDILPITVGAGTNIQEHALLHTSTGLSPCVVGRDVTVGHRAILHGCTVQDRCIVGMGSTILDGAVIEENCMIGANSLVSMNTRIPAGHLALGSPARVIRPLTETEISWLSESARHYQELGRKYRQSLSPQSAPR